MGDYPLKSMGHVAAVYKDEMYIHGGVNWNYHVCPELYKCDLKTYQFTNLSQNQAILKARWGNKYIKNCRACNVYCKIYLDSHMIFSDQRTFYLSSLFYYFV
jgi:hypothetical protein